VSDSEVGAGSGVRRVVACGRRDGGMCDSAEGGGGAGGATGAGGGG
jgi:hypothetical protein